MCIVQLSGVRQTEDARDSEPRPTKETHMSLPRSIPLDSTSSRPEAPGIASCSVDVAGTRWAVVDYEPGVLREEFCEEGHSGYVLAGEVTYEFSGHHAPLRVASGQGFVLPAGTDGAHRGRAGVAGARLFLIDRAVG
jgi:hypothetical protein